ncbi:MAG: metallopeptidase TldD-related protein [candidate division WOR-3 bacterium]
MARKTKRWIKQKERKDGKQRLKAEPWLLVLAGFFLIRPLVSYASDKNALLRALEDELARSITELQLPNQPKPYYLAYRVVDSKEVEIIASAGGLLGSNETHNRELFVDLRVGDYRMDNSNFICATSGSRIIESHQTQIPVEDDYLALRRAIWLVTDGTYKRALEVLAKKKAYLQNKQVSDTIPDFTRAKPCSLWTLLVPPPLDRNKLNREVVRISGILKQYPSIKESSVRFRCRTTDQYFLDSDGSKSLQGRLLTGIEVKAKAQAKNGRVMEDYIEFYAQKPQDFDFVDLEKKINAWAETLTMKIDIKPEDEGYTGPVLFLGPAACELFFQTLGKGVSGVREVLVESEILERNIMKHNLGLLSNRLGKRLLPEFIFSYDDPDLKEYNGIPLIGGYAVDEQGVKSEKIELIKEGKLINFPMSRTPTNKITTSNGHARYWNEIYVPRYVGFISNMVINSHKKLSEEKLVERLKEIARDYGNEYALIITRLQPTMPQNELQRYQRLYQTRTKSEPLLSSPLNIYKLDIKSNSLQLITGLDFAPLAPSILKDISAVGEKEYIYNFIYRNAYGDEIPVSVVAPAVLIEDLELIPKKEKIERPALVPRPKITRDHPF